MAESIFMRVRRLASASLEESFGAIERAGSTIIMREAIREVDRVMAEVRAEHEAAVSRRLHAERQQRVMRDCLARLDEKARFALGASREDLAEAAVTRQLDLEAQTQRLDAVQVEAQKEAGRLEDCLAELTERKAQMEQELANFESAQREAALCGDSPTRPGQRTERKVERAEAAFDRAMASAGGVSGLSRTDAQAAANVAEIDALQKSAAIAQRLAALRSARATGRP